ncbi:hypothetical protein [Nocardia sp. XZ_19_369]|uniref:hypothetical protein n=1 Tax=Nocardia sp. XZ_19_369 TaxID=2769487 RepID=UPI00189044DF|nr:hypothetical protein [Nocardia sp. XZ_19_369]
MTTIHDANVFTAADFDALDCARTLLRTLATAIADSEPADYLIRIADLAAQVALAERTTAPPAPLTTAAPESATPLQLITRAQAESWARRPLTNEDMDRLDTAIPHSSIPEAIATIVDGFDNT